jgi:hypothetical protein
VRHPRRQQDDEKAVIYGAKYGFHVVCFYKSFGNTMPPGLNTLFFGLLDGIVVLGYLPAFGFVIVVISICISPLLLFMFSFLYGHTYPIKSVPLFF